MDCLALNCIFVFISVWKGYRCKKLANAWNGCGGLTLTSHQNCSLTSPSSTEEGGKKCKDLHLDSCVEIKTGRSLNVMLLTYSQNRHGLGNYFNLLPIKS